jgi:hypothetical protein
MRLEQGHNAPAHVAAGDIGGCLGTRAWGSRPKGATGPIEQALVLPLDLVQHGSQAGDVLAVVSLPFLCSLELFTQDVHEVTIVGRQLTFTGRLYIIRVIASKS